ncbi:Uncharacterized protein Fot_55437 [Forsythia ovata]|uniref:MOB kinase activator-like 1A n=1 Tax=Forsythia ovata TaxID=205694 RepID=A0ABD1P6X8_9LAMI
MQGLQLQKHIDATLGSGNLREAVRRLPPGEDLNEWLAVNTVDFFNQVNLLYGTLTEFCTSSTCPTMSAGSKYKYRWADGITIKKPIEVSAPKYVEYLIDWIEAQLDDESIFPQKLGWIRGGAGALVGVGTPAPWWFARQLVGAGCARPLMELTPLSGGGHASALLSVGGHANGNMQSVEFLTCDEA